MPSLVRTLAMVLTLLSTVGPQVLAAMQSPAGCAEEEADCTDCSNCPLPCACCTVRVATVGGLAQVSVSPVPELSVVERLNEPVLAAFDPDIFHPPKA